MNLGISILSDRILIARHYGIGAESEYDTFLFGKSTLAEMSVSGLLWQTIGEKALGAYLSAEKIILAIPVSICFLKRLEINTRYLAGNPSYLDWLAATQLPGEVSKFRYGFLPLRESFDQKSVEMLFYACLANSLDPLISALKTENDSREISIIPEQLGLLKTLERSLQKDDIPQAAIIHCDSQGVSVAYMVDGRFKHCRYFHRDAGWDGHSADIETYLLSQADMTESLPLVITGFPGNFKTEWSPIVPSFMGIHNLEFAGAWGVAEYDSQP